MPRQHPGGDGLGSVRHAPPGIAVDGPGATIAHMCVIHGVHIGAEVLVTGAPAKVKFPIAGTSAEMWVNTNPTATPNSLSGTWRDSSFCSRDSIDSALRAFVTRTLSVLSIPEGKRRGEDYRMSSAQIDADGARGLAADAYTYGFAMVENYKAIFGMCVFTASPLFSGFNHYLHGRQLFDSSFDIVVNANNDTLYSTTFADLRAEPIAISVPATGDRYFVIQLIDMGTDNFAYIGTRATGCAGGEFLLVGPHFKGVAPSEPFDKVILAPSDFVALATRTAIDGADDLPGVIDVQDHILVRPLSTFLGIDPPAKPLEITWPPYSPSVHGSPQLFPILNFLLRYHVAPERERLMLERVSPIGVGPYRTFDLDDFEPDIRTAVVEGVADAHAAIERRGNSLGTVVQGWQDIPPMGTYGDDYLFRSAVAWKFIYTHSPEEALYPIAETDSRGEPLSGANEYRLRFAADQLPPVDAFWSITLYDSETRLMVDNPISRYSIGDRTAGLRYGVDCSLTLYIQHSTPGAENESNWLPAPEGRFYLNLRAYLPRTEFLDGSYRPPAVERVVR